MELYASSIDLPIRGKTARNILCVFYVSTPKCFKKSEKLIKMIRPTQN